MKSHKSGPGDALCDDGVTKCIANQCCPKYSGSDKTYPCPANKTFDKCEKKPSATLDCFPGDSVIQVEGKGFQETKGLEVGDRILAEGFSYEPVLGVLHTVEKQYTQAIT